MKLITNGDDFGLNQSITDAIIESHLNGFLTSTTIMSNMPAFEYAICKSKENPTLGVGIHFTLTEGKPVSNPNKIPILLNDSGYFKNNNEQRRNFLIPKKEKLKQIKIELEAQLSKMMDCGCKPTHFDSHHHITGLPSAFLMSMEVAKKYKVNKARITSIDYHFLKSYSSISKFKLYPDIAINFPKSLVHKTNKFLLRRNGFNTPDDKLLPARVLPQESNPIDHFMNILSILSPGITEISFHPGFEGSYPKDSKHFANIRVNDYNILTNKRIINYVKEYNIELANFKTAFGE